MEPISHTAELVTSIVALLLVAAGVMGLTKRLGLPFTVMLVLVGIGLTGVSDQWPEWFGFLRHLEISPDLILYVFLPTLVFESTFNMDTQQLRRNLGPVMALAVPGLLISTAVIGGIVWAVSDISLPAALLLGAILSATDPVAVIALFKQLGAPKRLLVLVEGESLFNDATSIVLAKILLGVLAAGMVSLDTVAGGVVDFVVLFLGGLLVGMFLGWIFGWLLGLVESDSLIEISLTMALAYLSFLVAEETFHVSGVMATVGAGVVLGSWGRVKISPPVRQNLEHIWEYLAFLANALIFLLVGMKVDLGALWGALDLLLVVILAMLLARAILMYGLIPLLGRLPQVDRIDIRYRTVMFWGGLRGAIALALVLSLEDFVQAELFLALVMGSVLFSLLVQGLSIGRLMHWLGLDQPPLLDRLAWLEFRLSAREQAQRQVPELQLGGRFSSLVAQRLSQDIKGDLQQTRGDLHRLRETELNPKEEESLLFLRAFGEEKALYAEMYAKGHLSEAAYRQLLLTLSLQIDAVRFRGRFEHVRTHRLRRGLEPRLFALLRWLGLAPWEERLRMNRVVLTYENAWAHYQGSRLVLERLSELQRLEGLPETTLEAVRANYQRWRLEARDQLDSTAEQFPEFVTAVQERLGRRMILLTEVATAEQQVSYGTLSREAAEHLEEGVRQQLRRLRGQEVSRLRVEPEELLRKVPLFAAVPEAEFKPVAGHMRARTFVAGELVIRQGEPGDSLFVIARGVVRVSRADGGTKRDLATLVAGDFFGEMALVHDEPRSATVRAVTPCVLYELQRSGLQAVSQRFPDIWAFLEEAARRRRESIADQAPSRNTTR